MTYDNWKCTDPNDQWLGPPPDEEEEEMTPVYENGKLVGWYGWTWISAKGDVR